MSATPAEGPVLIVLAAGRSARLGVPKALVRLRAREPSTPLGLLIAAGRAACSGTPLVVAGHAADEIAAALPAGCELVVNPGWAAGRTGGIALAAAARRGRDLCLAPVDVPLVRASTFAGLAACWRAAGAPERGWLAPFARAPGAAAGGKRFGHPILFGRSLAAELAGLPPDLPLRALRERAEPLLELEVDDPGVLDDLDDPADLLALRRRLEPG